MDNSTPGNRVSSFQYPIRSLFVDPQCWPFVFDMHLCLIYAILGLGGKDVYQAVPRDGNGNHANRGGRARLAGTSDTMAVGGTRGIQWSPSGPQRVVPGERLSDHPQWLNGRRGRPTDMGREISKSMMSYRLSRHGYLIGGTSYLVGIEAADNTFPLIADS